MGVGCFSNYLSLYKLYTHTYVIFMLPFFRIVSHKKNTVCQNVIAVSRNNTANCHRIACDNILRQTKRIYDLNSIIIYTSIEILLSIKFFCALIIICIKKRCCHPINLRFKVHKLIIIDSV